MKPYHTIRRVGNPSNIFFYLFTFSLRLVATFDRYVFCCRIISYIYALPQWFHFPVILHDYARRRLLLYCIFHSFTNLSFSRSLLLPPIFCITVFLRNYVHAAAYASLTTCITL